MTQINIFFTEQGIFFINQLPCNTDNYFNILYSHSYNNNNEYSYDSYVLT